MVLKMKTFYLSNLRFLIILYICPLLCGGLLTLADHGLGLARFVI